MIHSAVRLLRERGYSGMGFREVVKHSGAPRGSIYHHFPGGKAQLGVEAIGEFGTFVRDVIVAVAAAHPGDPVGALRAFIGAWRQIVEAENYHAGCPVVAVGIEEHEDAPQLMEAVVAAFDQWRTALAELLTSAGVPESRATTMATTAIAATEGAVIMCRARRDMRPLDEVAAELELGLRSALNPP
ncbi:TetR family transcriptional regulator [Kibdelosporangium phytohabitans]|uniref:TetR family transcriptional regulator n=2 Tax=Kibdelosporangium phytohabitans TaxID=860235 RepID=A0A0N9I8T8_9PSEU|nr:TetR/AcrR family transcriptional regulator [Kibdelosporangium phytohabitans]ALG15361.1 TetR family transcriptional regulator [Kibdelosporangium phytohabitans]